MDRNGRCGERDRSVNSCEKGCGNAAAATHKQRETGAGAVCTYLTGTCDFQLAKINGLCLAIARSEAENSPRRLAVPVTNNLLISLYRTQCLKSSYTVRSH